MGPYVFVFFCVYFFHWLQTLCSLVFFFFFFGVYSLFSVVSIVVMHAMCLSGLWFYLRNIDTDKQRQVRAFDVVFLCQKYINNKIPIAIERIS
jgi:amino acid transporter